MEGSKVKIPVYLKFGKIITYALYAWVMFGIIVLGIRVFLLVFSANPATPFVNFIYNTSATFLQPFRGIFPPKAVSQTGYLDVAALFAIIIYALIGWGFSALTHYMQSKINNYKITAREELQRKREDDYRVAASKSEVAKNQRPPAKRIQS
jgi:uncharacterized protein YggT (Ycf19 family)